MKDLKLQERNVRRVLERNGYECTIGDHLELMIVHKGAREKRQKSLMNGLLYFFLFLLIGAFLFIVGKFGRLLFLGLFILGVIFRRLFGVQEVDNINSMIEIRDHSISLRDFEGKQIEVKNSDISEIKINISEKGDPYIGEILLKTANNETKLLLSFTAMNSRFLEDDLDIVVQYIYARMYDSL